MTTRHLLLSLALLLVSSVSSADEPRYRIATFSTEVTCPLGHPLIAGLRAPAKEIVDPLYARGFVLLGVGEPIVLCTVDWCEIRNRSYDLWRDKLADAAGTKRERVLVTSLHQHDAPVTDVGAEELLDKVGLGGAMFDPAFERKCIERTARAVKTALKKPRRITHLGIGQAKAEKLASNRRVVLAKDRVTYSRGSSSGGNKTLADAPDGVIDPWVKLVSLWDGDEPVLALSAYAIHPMSYYGRGGVSADFVGMARTRMEKEYPSVFQLYVAGCSGDVTAGKYNNGAVDLRPVLADRLFTAMNKAWKATKRLPLNDVTFRTTQLDLPFRDTEKFSAKAMRSVLEDKKAAKRNRILAAMGLSSRKRVESGQKIDMGCIDFGSAQVVLCPGESFVEYQLVAQKMRLKSFVMTVGYGECWPGYIPSTQAFADRFDDVWYWVGPGSDKKMRKGLEAVLAPR